MNVGRLSNAQVVGVSGVKRNGVKLVIHVNSIITTYTCSYNILKCIYKLFYSLKYKLLNSHYNLLCITDIVCFHRLSNGCQVHGMAGKSSQTSQSVKQTFNQT